MCVLPKALNPMANASCMASHFTYYRLYWHALLLPVDGLKFKETALYSICEISIYTRCIIGIQHMVKMVIVHIVCSPFVCTHIQYIIYLLVVRLMLQSEMMDVCGKSLWHAAARLSVPDCETRHIYHVSISGCHRTIEFLCHAPAWNSNKERERETQEGKGL